MGDVGADADSVIAMFHKDSKSAYETIKRERRF